MNKRYQLRFPCMTSAQRLATSAYLTSAQRLAPRAYQRRGILLLVVLGLLTLFLFIGTAFVISSNQFRMANRSYQQVGNQENIAATQRNFLDEVLNQLVRDTNNQNSALRYHSLLRDMYGTEGFTATIENVRWAQTPGVPPVPPNGVTHGQFIEFTLRNNSVQDLYGNNVALPYPIPAAGVKSISPLDNYYKGQLVSFVSPSSPASGNTVCLAGASTGSQAGASTRIVSYIEDATDPNNLIYWFRVLAPPLANGQPLTTLTNLSDLNGTQIVVNGRPFNGTGVGFNPSKTTGPKLDAMELVNGTAREISLMPNAAFFDFTQVVASTTGLPVYWDYFQPRANPAHPQYNANTIKAFDGRGGSDESYDATDFQNMFLAWSPPGPVDQIAFGSSTLGSMVLPSFHRPALINYWNAQNALIDTSGGSPVFIAAMLRKVLLRPSWMDHPNFTGSNPYFAQTLQEYKANPNDPVMLQNLVNRMIYGPWDVDNDKDGTPDSVWVDFGAPIIAGPDGKLVKPLAAILVLDLDGRLNVNAHGTRELAGLGDSTNPTGSLAAGQNWNSAPEGQAFGPAEISLKPLLNDDQFRRLLQGGNGYTGRYGTGPNHEPGIDDKFDLAAQLKMQGYPQANVIARSNFGTLPDLRARYSMGLNDFGQSITDFSSNNTNFDRLTNDNPYELNLSATAARGTGTSVDNPFSLFELERLLRAYDMDSPTLPPRLYELLNASSNLPTFRALLTTDSYDLPVPGFQMPEWVRLGPDGVPAGTDDFVSVMGRQPVNATFADLIEYRLRQAQGLPLVLTTTQQNTLRAQMSMLIAPEMMAGLKLDLNRPLGNGRDDNNNGVVDEPGEVEGAKWAFDGSRMSANDANNPALNAFIDSPSNDADTNPDTNLGIYRDAVDRNGDGAIEPWERGDTDGDGTLSQIELVNLHNFRRQLLARHLYVLAQAVVDPFDLTSNEGKAKSRQLAQWAINAVDFRDPDNIMTAFEYDANPFDGWQVDGDLNTNDWAGADGNPGTNDDIGAVIWGLEQPELLMTEVIAWHDRRTTDTASEAVDPSRMSPPKSQPGSVEDTDPTRHDVDLDSQYRPLGATFIELYNPSAASPGASADTHAIQGVNYNAALANMPVVPTGTDLGINLSAVAVDPTNPANNSPVWRIQVVHKRKKNATNTAFIADYSERLLFFDPDDKTTLTGVQRPDVDRTIYFAREGVGPIDPNFPNNAPLLGTNYQTIDSADGVEFFTNQAIRPVRPGTYMVVGGGVEVTPGSNVFQSPVGLTYHPSDLTKRNKIGRRIELHSGVSLTGNTLTSAPVQMFNPPANSPLPFTMPTLVTPKSNSGEYVADVAIINRVIDRNSQGVIQGPDDRGFSLSEPAGGYPDQILGSVWTTNTPPNGPEVEGWYVSAENPSVPQPVDIPLDENDGVVQAADPDIRTYGTVQGYRWLYLQRLANPLLPFNPELDQPGHVSTRAVNPYRTIDHTSANLSVFNGMLNSAILTPDLNPEYGDGPEPNKLASLERGWKNDPKDLTRTTYAAQKDTHLKTNPFHVENSGLRPRDNSVFLVGSDHYFNAMPDCTLGHLNRSFNNDYATDKVIPDQPFPWLTWNNRPFANPGELIQVPAVRSSQVTQAFTFLDPASIDNNLKQEVFQGQINTPPPPNGNPYYNLFSEQFVKADGPFGHLMNFFRTDSKGVDNVPGTADDQGIAGLYRVLDLVDVPSRYVGTETWLSPATFGNTVPPSSGSPTATEPGPVLTTSDPRYGWQPPFNRLPSRREPGKVNINTITQREVWNGLTHDSKHFGPDDDDVWPSRRGYQAGGTDPTILEKESPTLFANPFRAAGTGSFVPIQGLVRESLDATLFRSSDLSNLSGTPPQPNSVPLFATTAIADTDGNSTIIEAPENKFRDSARNAYFRYSPISRLSSLTTTRSNVFAVWITVGFFEVEQAPTYNAGDPRWNGSLDLYNRVYPDGYQFTKEAGSATGDYVRVRKFAIVDRTIPVGFQPGANHNVKETIRLKREIE